MLRKLLKHELRASAHTMLPVFAGVLLAALGGNIAIHHLVDANLLILRLLGFLLMAAFVVLMMSVGIVTFVMMLRRFYGNLLRDEGYLMMTLPVSVNKQILSKTVVAVLWFVLTGAVMALALLILVYDQQVAKGFAELAQEFVENWRVLWNDIILENRSMLASLMVYLPIALVLGLANMCVNCYAAMAVGHSFSGHKGLLSFVSYIVITVIWQMLGTGTMWVMNRTGLDARVTYMLSQMPRTTEVHVVMLGSIALLVLGCAVMHAVTAYFLKNRLNLD